MLLKVNVDRYKDIRNYPWFWQLRLQGFRNYYPAKLQVVLYCINGSVYVRFRNVIGDCSRALDPARESPAASKGGMAWLPIVAILALWALAGLAHHSTTPLLWWAGLRIGPWIVCTAMVSQCHRTICASCCSLRTLDRWLRILTASLTFLLGAGAFVSTI